VQAPEHVCQFGRKRSHQDFIRIGAHPGPQALLGSLASLRGLRTILRALPSGQDARLLREFTYPVALLLIRWSW
jgi:hypothetical protein